MSNLVRTQIVGFLMHRLNYYLILEINLTTYPICPVQLLSDMHAKDVVEFSTEHQLQDCTSRRQWALFLGLSQDSVSM